MREKNKKQIGGIYKITNLINGKIYIGSATYIKQRFGIHKYMLRNNNHDNSYLQNAWNKYGERNFEFKILEEVEDFSKLEEREQFWIDATFCYQRDIGYNLRLFANNNNGISYNVGRKHSEETKRKISEKQKGKIISQETREKTRQRQLGKAPMHATEAARIAIRSRSKWPHGHQCRCNECKIIRNNYLKEWRALKRGAIAGRKE